MSICAEISTPLDPASVLIHPSPGTPTPAQGELLEDIKMADTPEAVVEEMLLSNAASPATTTTNGAPNGMTNGANGAHCTDADGDVTMDQVTHVNGHSDTKRAAPHDSLASHGSPSDAASPSLHASADADDDDAKPPPAKRARKLSDADQASIANTASPPPITASSIQTNGDTVVSSPTPAPPTPSQPGAVTLSIQQHRFCLSTVRSLKKMKDAAAFLHPVDPSALNIPHYPTIIKNPMDLGTIERKLSSSNPQKPDPNSNNPRYNNADEFIADVRLVFSNCVTFNGPDHVVSKAGKHVESVFDKQIKNLPPPQVVKPPVAKVATPPPPPPPVPAKKAVPAPPAPTRRASTSVPVIRRNEAEQAATARPKREIHPPPPKDLPYADVPKKMRKTKAVKHDGTAEQLKFCVKLLTELHRKQHWTIANPFYEPVDPVKLDIPTYFKIIKKPMDLSSMRRKLENHEYPNASKFFDDFKLMIRNCFTFNPAGTPVNQAGIELQRLFDEKWKNLPPLREASEEEEEEEQEDESEEERNRGCPGCARQHACANVSLYTGRIASMEAQIESMRGNLLALKNQPQKEKKKKKKEPKPAVASTSKASASRVTKATGAGNGVVKRKTKKPIPEDDTLSFDQKKDLSEAITKLDGQRLEKVIQIIHEGVPEIRDSTEEIELEIDLLPVHVLTKLYNFVLRPLRQPAQKRSRATGKGTGTGGLKRKSMDENAEAEKIRQLEERMRLFDNPPLGTGAVPPPPIARHDDSEHSSDSSSDDSSGSESE
ncbi:Bromodomain-containing protein [Paxillus ammoniavirescens]|nr:Bromodomain-containing protein [Paxillus ammoniavirescens]